MKILVEFIDAIFPFAVGILILVKPQVFTKTDLSLEENQKAAGLLKKGGVCLLIAGVFIFIAHLMTK
jgi:hypothetical protein